MMKSRERTALPGGPALPIWALLLGLAAGMPALEPLFARVFPELQSPLYPLDSFLTLLAAHIELVALSSSLALLLGVAAGIAATRRGGSEFRPLLERVVAIGQTIPPVAVLAIVVPLLGFGMPAAVLALALYGLLPIVQGTLAGLDAVPDDIRQAADGLGMSAAQSLWRIELPLALPAMLGGIRTSIIINIGTAAVASAAGAKTLGSPIIVGLNGFNTAYIVQGASLVGLLAIAVDSGFEYLECTLTGWRHEGSAPAVGAHDELAQTLP
ncbi:ABC transporter permease [Paludibacterium yongneupense]|uniref:ABC transporter permease n=1 Tax=Paludibacterium yongneupense TaxID=400061 RepID=UPI00041E55A1|nr:ABC transporter permease [Paludibacterium yongneupense]